MAQSITCPKCKRVYAVKPELAGKKAKCKCGERIEFPAAGAPRPVSELDLLSDEPKAAKVSSKQKAGFEALESPSDPYDVVETAPKKVAKVADGSTCSNCGAALAPAAVLCTACGFNQRTGSKIKTQVVAGSPGVLPYKSQQVKGSFGPSENRTKAGRICIVLAVLMYLAGTCVGVVTVLFFAVANSAKIAAQLPPGVAAIAGVVLLIATLLVLGIATTYLVCGISIRRGGFVAVIIALIVGGLHEILALINFAMGAFAMATGEGSYFGLGINILFVSALGQLIYYLVKILMERRQGA